LNFTFHAYGHPAVLSTHPSTIEITKETHLSAKGDCIVAVNSSAGPADLSADLRRALRRPSTKAQLILKVGRFQFTVEGEGAPELTLSHPTDFVIRKSGFVSDRTLIIHANRAAKDIPREMVKLLQDPTSKLTVEILTVSTG
jgi:hypothetical protein